MNRHHESIGLANGVYPVTQPPSPGGWPIPEKLTCKGHCLYPPCKNFPYKNPSQPGLVAQLNTTHAIQPTHYQSCLFIFLSPAGHPTQQIIAEYPFLGRFCIRVGYGHDWHHDNLPFVGHPCAHLPQQVVCLIFTSLGVVEWNNSSDSGFYSHPCSLAGLARKIAEKGWLLLWEGWPVGVKNG